jgi:hypothetical protein
LSTHGRGGVLFHGNSSCIRSSLVTVAIDPARLSTSFRRLFDVFCDGRWGVPH